MGHSSSGPGHRPLKAEIAGSNPACPTSNSRSRQSYPQCDGMQAAVCSLTCLTAGAYQAAGFTILRPPMAISCGNCESRSTRCLFSVNLHKKICRLPQPMTRAPLFSCSVAIENRRRHTHSYAKALSHHCDRVL